MSIKITPMTGAEDVRFGTSVEELVERLGPPITEQTLNDVDTHPKSRRVLNYGKRGFLVIPKHGVISIDVEAEQSKIELWDTPINDMSPAELLIYLKENGCEARVTRPDQSNDQEVDALSHGIIASFCDGKLESIEVHHPSWWQHE